ncbi:hypothetical protein CP532_2787 [Ophiocordyceps camponoti-leonardi (nom. inval.)]|nr:hypothetical protein CP532_2787 [Ophiocordyceps camponoti-leonardi (nom. inval.)]
MGGSAFSSGTDPLFTPRMPPPVYDKMRKHCTALLSNLFRTVASPIDGPGKSDFGDVDMMVCGPIEVQTTLQDVAEVLDARRSIFYGCRSANFALEWPLSDCSDEEEKEVEEEKQEEEGSEKTKQRKNRYVQVDVCVCPDDDALSWLLFIHAHGDLGSILRSIVSPYGLTMAEHGLFIRIPEMEASRPKQARVFITRDPNTSLQIFGLPAERFWSGPFADADDMFEFASLCPMFSAGGVDDDGGDDDDKDHKRRLRTRPVFRRWTVEFRSGCRRKGLFLQPRTSRESMTESIMKSFPSVRAAYTDRRFGFLREQQERRIRNELIPPFASASAAKQEDTRPHIVVAHRACISKALARLVLSDEESFVDSQGVVVKSPDDGFVDAESGLYDLDRVEAFVREHCDAVAVFAMERHWATMRTRLAARPRQREQGEEEL